MKPLNSKDIIKAIEEYRKAFWAHRNLQFVKDNKYSPVVGWHHTSQYGKKPLYHVWLNDTWVNMRRHGMFTLGQSEVPHSRFKAESLEMALQELLNFCRLHFMDDKLFNRIRVLESGCQDENDSRGRIEN